MSTRKVRVNGVMTKFAFDKTKKYKYDKTGDLVEATTVADDDIIISGSKSSLRRLAELERNVSILTTKTLTATSSDTWDSEDDNYGSIFDEDVRFKGNVSLYGADNINFAQSSTTFGTSMTNAVRSAVSGYSQPAGTYNTIIGTDTDINTSGATIIDNIYVTDGVITSMGTRVLTAGDLSAYTSAQTDSAISTAISNLVDSAPGTLDTLNELAAALGDDPNFATTVTNSIATKVTTGSSEYIKGATVSNDTITFTRGDNTTFSVTTSDANTVYAGWNLLTDGTSRGAITSAENVNFIGGTNVSIAYSATNNAMTFSATDTNTWRPVEDVLTSTSTTNSLSANQGRVLKAAVDGKLASTANAVSASKLATARTITVSGAVTGSTSFDGSGNVTITTTATSDPVLTLTGDVTGSATFTNLGNASLTATVANDSHNHTYLYNGATARATATTTGVSINGALVASGDVTAYSDERLKDNIEVIADAGAKVAALRGVTFTHKDTGVESTGLIAQDVKAVLPEATTTDEDGMIAVKYGNLVGLLVEAVKELQAEVKALKGE